MTLVGFGWDGADESKMRASFGVGRACFGAFLDLQRVAASLGYSNYGLSALAVRVLALNLPKPRAVRAMTVRLTVCMITSVCAKGTAARMGRPYSSGKPAVYCDIALCFWVTISYRGTCSVLGDHLMHDGACRHPCLLCKWGVSLFPGDSQER